MKAIRSLITRIVNFFNTTKRAQRQHMKEWIAALRSGKYNQGPYTLRNENDQFCCLGVACDISHKGQWQNDRPGGLDRYRYVTASTKESALLPMEVAEYFGLTKPNPAIIPAASEDDYDVSATTANDIRRMTFAEIADKLEENYL